MALGFETVDGAFGEKNHMFARFLTKQQVERRSFTWGRGKGTTAAGLTGGTFFSLAAIETGQRGQIPLYTSEWFNEAVPPDILKARSVVGLKVDGGQLYICRQGENWIPLGGYGGQTLAVTLTLRMGEIGPAVPDNLW